jgi:hypothetical protein
MTLPSTDVAASPEPARVIYLPDNDLAPLTKPLHEIESEICELAGHIAAATCKWLLLIAEFDRRSGWAVDGVLSMAHWLSWRCGVDLHTAREHVRVGRALEQLPRISDAFMLGRLSYSKVRAVVRIATPALEETLLNIAQHATGAQVERLVSGYRRAGRLMNPDKATRSTCAGITTKTVVSSSRRAWPQSPEPRQSRPWRWRGPR